jgi:hypothetical protein
MRYMSNLKIRPMSVIINTHDSSYKVYIYDTISAKFRWFKRTFGYYDTNDG